MDNMIYKDYIDSKYINELEKLHEQKLLLKSLIDLKQINDPLIIELSGLPRTGKTTTFEQLYDFFKKGGFNIIKIKEPAYLIKQSLNLEELKNLSDVEFNDKTLEISRNSLIEAKQIGADIIIMDRGIIDNFFWYQLYFDKNLIDKDNYDKYMKKLYEDIKLLDKLFVLTASTNKIITRDYNSSIYLEKRNKKNKENIEQLARAYNHLSTKLIEHYNDLIIVDTTYMSSKDTSIYIASESIKTYQKKINSRI